ncbi:MAG: aspartyl/glutamyl-tRNA amidotransferase subunit A [Treponema sp.]|jgi:aspartyl-tRNA(Asn)/glutamyl-tRNA(Gln) amidotransferase subunit A|nr:aspartyl/glutamyl-tRNA amidotransferase subunit A [Treponema sp.]
MQNYTEYFKNWEKKIGAFIEIDERAIERSGTASDTRTGERNSVAGLPFAVKDNIAVQGRSISCASKLLENVKSPYTATVVEKLEAKGAYVIGKTNLDEFGMGSSTDNSALKKTNNPWDTDRVAGGSSGGSAAAVAAGLVPFALGTDTGGSIRQPAAFCGVVGLKPTYGAVSRFGLVAYASSLEAAGVLADSAERCRTVFSVIRGKDEKDQTSIEAPANAPAQEEKNGKARTIGVLSAASVAKAIASAAAESGGADSEQAIFIAAQAATLEEEVRKGFETAKKNLAALGHALVDVEIPSLKYGVPAYYTIATAEASANLARFDGIRYGKRPDWAENPDDLIDKAREAGFGSEVKLRILLGTFVLRSGFQDRYYLRAQRIRAGIRRNFETLLGAADYTEGGAYCDAILLPAFPTRAFDRGPSTLSPFAQKAADLYTCCANLAGLPALSFPASVENGLPVGIQLLGRAFAEATLLDIAEGYEQAYPLPHPAGYESFWEYNSRSGVAE